MDPEWSLSWNLGDDHQRNGYPPESILGPPCETLLPVDGSGPESNLKPGCLEDILRANPHMLQYSIGQRLYCD